MSLKKLSPQKPVRRAGFTVIELLAVVALVAVVLVLFFRDEPTLQPAAEGDIAIGYEYKSPDRMKTVRVGKPLKGGQSKFELMVEGKKFEVQSEKPFWFTTSGFPDGVESFIIRGINPSEQLDVNNNLAFPVGISWMTGGPHELKLTAIPYKPPWWKSSLMMWIGILTAVAVGGGGLFWWWRKSQAD
jgi:prepilin-type N-terminal cleavage/methylation domain-containing protein